MDRDAGAAKGPGRVVLATLLVGKRSKAADTDTIPPVPLPETQPYSDVGRAQMRLRSRLRSLRAHELGSLFRGVLIERRSARGGFYCLGGWFGGDRAFLRRSGPRR